MRGRRSAYTCVLVLMTMVAAPVWAQTPSSDQIIRALKPGDGPRISRGIRVLGPTSEGAAPSAGGGVPAPSIDLTVNFVSGSAELSPSAIRALDELGRALTSASLTGFRFRVEGHTDTVGAPDMNKALSERRAAAVVDYLALKWRVDRAKVEAVGRGQEQLAVPTGPNVAQARNRRVTVVNLGA